MNAGKQNRVLAFLFGCSLSGWFHRVWDICSMSAGSLLLQITKISDRGCRPQSAAAATDPWSAVMQSKVSTRSELASFYSVMNPQMCQMFTCPCFPSGSTTAAAPAATSSPGVFFSAWTLAGRRTSFSSDKFRGSWWTKVSAARSLSPARRLHRFSASSVFSPQRCAEGWRSTRFWKNGGKEKFAVYITSRFRKRSRRRRMRRTRKAVWAPLCPTRDKSK